MFFKNTQKTKHTNPTNPTIPNSKPLTPRTVRAIDNYVQTLHIRDKYEFDKRKSKSK